MPKADKPSKASAARSAAHPTSVSKGAAASSKKKKKSVLAPAHHAASLHDDIQQLENPGKLKPAKPTATSKLAKSAKQQAAEEMKLENQLLTAAATKQAKRKGAIHRDADHDAMEDDGADDLADDQDEDEDAAEMLRDEAAPISARLSAKILASAHAQQREELEGEGIDEERHGANTSARRMKQLISLQSTVDGEEEYSDADDDDEGEVHSEEEIEDLGEVELSAEDQASLEMFMPKSNTLKSKSLADVILEKMREKEAEAQGDAPTHSSNVRFGPGFGMPVTASAQPTMDAAEVVRSKIDPKIVEVYTKVGKFLSHYTSGKIPKAFKLIPNLKSWEEILFLTSPESWSSQAYFVATKIFSSNFNPKMAQRFYSVILLPKIRNDIESHKHLNFHLYQAIKKSLYKPAAFFKGLLLPLAEEGATARESVIMSSILAKCTIPVLHSSVALLKLAQLPYSGTTALFMRTLINKKYSLPRKVLAQLTQYFCAFLNKSAGGAALGHMPLIWHQTLLAFVQRYKLELTANQQTALKNLIKVQSHHGVTPEIRRELAAVTQAAPASMVTPTGVHFAGAAKPTTVQTATTFSFGLTPGFTSLAAAIKNPTTFTLPTTTTNQAMEQ